MTHPLGMVLAVTLAIPTTLFYGGMPPERFQGDGMLTVGFTHDLNSTCGTPPPNMHWEGCRRGGVTYMPNPCPIGSEGDHYAVIWCHELAHWHNWPATHGP